MAVDRGPLIFRTWQRDPAGVATRSQKDVSAPPPGLTLLKSLDTFFGLAGNPTFDWPNPRGPAQGAITNKTWVDPFKLPLQGKDTFFGLAGHPTFDWPNPRGYVPAIVLRTHTDPTKFRLIGQDIITGARGQVPDYDWPNPRGPQFSVTFRTWTDQTKINLVGQDQFFGLGGSPKFDWPNPRGPQFPISLRSWSVSIGGFFPPPAAQYDWPNPKGYVPSISLKTWVDPTKVNLAGLDTFFGLAGKPNYDWPNPRGYARSVNTGELLNLLATTLGTPVVVAAPFSMTSWPNPPRRTPSMTAIASTDGFHDTTLTLAGFDEFWIVRHRRRGRR